MSRIFEAINTPRATRERPSFPQWYQSAGGSTARSEAAVAAADLMFAKKCRRCVDIAERLVEVTDGIEDCGITGHNDPRIFNGRNLGDEGG